MKMSIGIGSESRRDGGKFRFSFPILLLFCMTILKCGAPIRYDIKPEFRDRDIEFSFDIKNKFLSRSIHIRSVRFDKIKTSKPDLELESKCLPANKPMTEVGASDFETFLGRRKTEPVFEAELPSDLGSVSSLSLFMLSMLSGPEYDFRGRLSTGYYMWRSISSPQYSFGLDRQEFLFYVDDSRDEIRFCMGVFSGHM